MKKAFTLVELLVVVAILAILASVAIIGYSSFTKKAQQSVDEQAVTQLNTLLTGLDTLDMPENINEFYEQMHVAGLSAKDYKPLYNDRYFFWDKNLNQVLYTDKSYNVLYPEKYVGDSSVSNNTHQWYSLSGSINTETATVVIPSTAPNNSTQPQQLAASSAGDFIKISEYTKTKTDKSASEVVNLKVDLSNDIDLMGADTTFLEVAKDNSTINIDGNENTLKGLYISDNHATTGQSSSGERQKYGCAMFNKIKDLVVKDITIDGATIGSSSNPQSQTAIFAGQVTNSAYFENVTIKNCVLYGGKKSGLLIGYFSKTSGDVASRLTYKNVRIENCTVVAGNGEVGLITGCYINKPSDASPLLVGGNDVTIINSKVEVASNLETYTLNGKVYIKDPKDNAWRVGINTFGFVSTVNDGTTTVANKENVGDIMWKYLTGLAHA